MKPIISVSISWLNRNLRYLLLSVYKTAPECSLHEPTIEYLRLNHTHLIQSIGSDVNCDSFSGLVE